MEGRLPEREGGEWEKERGVRGIEQRERKWGGSQNKGRQNTRT